MVILFDGYCNLCNHSVHWLLNHGVKNDTKFSSLQGEFAQTLPLKGMDLTQPNSIVVWENNCMYQKSAAVLIIIKMLPLPWKILLVGEILPKWLLDWMYDQIARNRYNWFGHSTHCLTPNTEEKKYFLP